MAIKWLVDEDQPEQGTAAQRGPTTDEGTNQPTPTPGDTILGETTKPPVVRNDWPTDKLKLYGGIEKLYQQYLKRTPNEQEVSGHMPNPGGLAGVEKTILDSPEYRALTGGTGGGDPNDPGAPDPSDYWHWFKQLTVNKGLRANSDTLKSLESVLAKYNIKVLQNAAGIYGKIQLPNGQIVDVVRAAGAGGGGPDYWQWDTGGGTTGGDTTGGGSTVGNLPGWVTTLAGDQYNDPYTLQLEQLIKERMNQLMQPINNDYVNQYGSLLQGRVNDLQGNSPEIQALVDALNKRITDLGGMDEYAKQLQQRNTELKGTTEALQKLMDFASNRAEELKGPEYTGAQQEIFRTQALDPIERDRTAAKQRVLANLATRGLDLNSGIAQSALNEADRAYDALRASAQGDIASEQAASYSARQDQVMQILNSLAQIPELRADQALAVMQELQTYLTGREQEALQLRGTVADIPETRKNQAVQYGGELAKLSDWATNRQDTQASQAIALSAILADLGPQRLQAALATLGQGSTPAGVFNSLATLANIQGNQQVLNLQNNAATASALGTTLGYLFSNLNKTTSTPNSWTSGMDAFAGV